MSAQWVSAAVPFRKFVLVTQSTQNVCHCKLSPYHPRTRTRWAIKNLHRDARSQQVSRKVPCKNAEFREWVDARSTGRNEKPHRARGSAGLSPSQRLVLPMLLAGQKVCQHKLSRPHAFDCSRTRHQQQLRLISIRRDLRGRLVGQSGHWSVVQYRAAMWRSTAI